MTTEVKVDDDFKDKVAADKEAMKEQEEKARRSNYVACAEVTEYLTDLSTVLENISTGIKESIVNMEKRMEQKGDANEHKE